MSSLNFVRISFTDKVKDTLEKIFNMISIINISLVTREVLQHPSASSPSQAGGDQP